MLNVKKTNANDLLAMAGAAKLNKGQTVQGNFKNLLDVAMKTPDKATAKDKPAKPAKSMEASEPLTPEIQDQSVPTDPAAAAAALATQGQPQQQQGDGTKQPAEGQATAITGTQATAEATEAIVPMIPVQTEAAAPAQAQQGGDILAVQTNVIDAAGDTAQAQPGAQTPEIVTEEATQDRFGNMLNQAQQELQDYQNPPQVELTEPELEAAQDIEAPEIEIPEQTTEPEAEPLPGEAVKLDTEAGESDAVIATPRRKVTVEPTPMEQKPLREIPKQDRAVMEMRETAVVIEPKPTEPVRVERTPEPMPTQQPQQPQQNGMPDQTEQIRAQVTENLNRTNMEFRMQLQPQELGKIDVKMVIEGGRLAVEIMAAGTRTTDLLKGQVDSLVHALRLHTGMEIQSVQVVQAQNTSSHMDGAFNMMNGQAQNGGYQGQGQQGRGPTPSGQNAAAGEAPGQEEEQAEPESLLNYAI